MNLKLSNVKCAGCVATVKELLQNIEGISDITVSLPDGNLDFNIKDESRLSEIHEKLRSAGYPVLEA